MQAETKKKRTVYQEEQMNVISIKYKINLK